MAQRADVASGDVDRTHVEELDLRHWPAVQPFQDLRCIRALNLVAVTGANNGFALRIGRGPVVFLDFQHRIRRFRA